jgi:predicted TIM-barrel fold metal-dependent hydrolase
MIEMPRIISVDDHVVEPPNLWQDGLPAQFKAQAPRVERRFGYVDWTADMRFNFVEDKDAPEARWGDVWVYDDLEWPLTAGYAQIGSVGNLEAMTAITYDDIEMGCYVQAPRLADMEINHTDASLCFPTFPRFCGQTFLERGTRDLSLACIRTYNDWMIEEWCGGRGAGHLIPLTLIPLWDAELAADEIRRCAAKGSFAITFSECPPHLGLPSIHSGYWNPVFAACHESDTVVNMHIGSSSRAPVTSDDAPILVTSVLTSQNSEAAFADWLSSGLLATFPSLRIVLSEGQVGWMPYILERLDSGWDRSAKFDRHMRDRIPERPSSYMAGRVFGCIFDDAVGLRNRDVIGMSQIMFETDYPHADSTFPNSRQVAEKMIAEAGLNDQEARSFVRGNAISCYGLSRFGITS